MMITDHNHKYSITHNLLCQKCYTPYLCHPSFTVPGTTIRLVAVANLSLSLPLWSVWQDLMRASLREYHEEQVCVQPCRWGCGQRIGPHWVRGHINRILLE